MQPVGCMSRSTSENGSVCTRELSQLTCSVIRLKSPLMGERASSSKSDRRSETRELLLVTAERLFAEHGVEAVSNRQVSEAAGQSNNFAVGYHFGSKEELVVAIVRRHSESIERRRTELLAEISGSPDLR